MKGECILEIGKKESKMGKDYIEVKMESKEKDYGQMGKK